MHGFTSYEIRDNDRFNPLLYPEVKDELDNLFAAVYLFTTPEKENIIISWLKQHSLHSFWLKQHAELCHIMIDGNLHTSHTEALFEACRGNLQFLHSFEEYIRNLVVE